MRLTEFALPSSIAAVLSSGPLPVERTRNVLLGVLYSNERLLQPILSRGGRSITPNVLFVQASYSLRVTRFTQNIPCKRIFLWPIKRNSADYLTESIAH